MAFDAQRDFPEIDFSRSVMVGDTESDMAFGLRLNMCTVWIAGKEEEAEGMASIGSRVDFRFDSLAAFAHALR